MANIFTPDWVPESHRETFSDQANLILSEFPTITPEALNNHWETFSLGGTKWIDFHDKKLRDFAEDLKNESELKALISKGNIEFKGSLATKEVKVHIKSDRLQQRIIEFIRWDIQSRGIEYETFTDPDFKPNKGRYSDLTRNHIINISICHHAIFAYYNLPDASEDVKYYLIGLLLSLHGYQEPFKIFLTLNENKTYKEYISDPVRTHHTQHHRHTITELIKTHLKTFEAFYPDMEPRKQLTAFCGVNI